MTRGLGSLRLQLSVWRDPVAPVPSSMNWSASQANWPRFSLRSQVKRFAVPAAGVW